jgi:hypothetical protein
MQFQAVNMLLFDVAMTVQTHTVGHLTWLFDLALVTGLIATCLVENKVSMIYRHESTLDDCVWHLVTAFAIGLNNFAVTLFALEEMACKTYIIVHAEVLISFKATVTCATRDSYPVDYFFDMIPVGELDSTVVDIR